VVVRVVHAHLFGVTAHAELALEVFVGTTAVAVAATAGGSSDTAAEVHRGNGTAHDDEGDKDGCNGNSDADGGVSASAGLDRGGLSGGDRDGNRGNRGDGGRFGQVVSDKSGLERERRVGGAVLKGADALQSVFVVGLDRAADGGLQLTGGGTEGKQGNAVNLKVVRDGVDEVPGRKHGLDVADTVEAAGLFRERIGTSVQDIGRTGNFGSSGLRNNEGQDVVDVDFFGNDGVVDLDANLERGTLGERSRDDEAVDVVAEVRLDWVVEIGVGGVLVGGRTVGGDAGKREVRSEVDGNIDLGFVEVNGHNVTEGVLVVVIDTKAEVDVCRGGRGGGVVDGVGDGRLDDIEVQVQLASRDEEVGDVQGVFGRRRAIGLEERGRKVLVLVQGTGIGVPEHDLGFGRGGIESNLGPVLDGGDVPGEVTRLGDDGREEGRQQGGNLSVSEHDADRGKVGW